MMNAEQKETLRQKAADIRRDIVEMIGVGKAGHLGGSCSIADIVSVLYFHHMKFDPKNPSMADRDRFILSKGHAALVQYAALMECGVIDREANIHTFKKLGSNLQGHADMRRVAGIEANTGSLGQGVSIATGMAAGLKLDGNSARVYVVTGDGELAEGQIWEAFMASVNYRLDNLVIIIDHNGLQATGRTEERFKIDHLEERIRAFGLEVIPIDGHDIGQIEDAFEKAEKIKGRPTCIIAETVKGKGIPFAENVAAFHNGKLTQEQYDEAVNVLGRGAES